MMVNEEGDATASRLNQNMMQKEQQKSSDIGSILDDIDNIMNSDDGDEKNCRSDQPNDDIDTAMSIATTEESSLPGHFISSTNTSEMCKKSEESILNETVGTETSLVEQSISVLDTSLQCSSDKSSTKMSSSRPTTPLSTSHKSPVSPPNTDNNKVVETSQYVTEVLDKTESDAIKNISEAFVSPSPSLTTDPHLKDNLKISGLNEREVVEETGAVNLKNEDKLSHTESVSAQNCQMDIVDLTNTDIQNGFPSTAVDKKSTETCMEDENVQSISPPTEVEKIGEISMEHEDTENVSQNLFEFEQSDKVNEEVSVDKGLGSDNTPTNGEITGNVALASEENLELHLSISSGSECQDVSMNESTLNDNKPEHETDLSSSRNTAATSFTNHLGESDLVNDSNTVVNNDDSQDVVSNVEESESKNEQDIITLSDSGNMDDTITQNSKSNFLEDGQTCVKESACGHKENTMNNTDSIELDDSHKTDNVEENSLSGIKQSDFTELVEENATCLDDPLKTDNTAENSVTKESVITELEKKKANQNNSVDDSIKMTEKEQNETNKTTQDGFVGEDDQSADKKRKCNFSVESESQVTPKRSKVEETIASVASAQDESNVTMVVDSDDDVILTQEVFVKKEDGRESKKSDVKEEKVDMQMCKDEDQDKKYELDVKDRKIEVAQDYKTLSSPIDFTSQVLQCFFAARLKAFYKRRRQQQIEKLNKQFTATQSSINLWKETAKHLNRSVKEVTVVNESFVKGKSRLRSLTTQNVGTQVQPQSPQNINRSNVPVHQNTIQNHQRLTNSVTVPASPLLQHLQARPGQKVNGNSTRPQVQSNNIPTPSRPNLVTPPVAPAADVVNLIDLTDEEDITNKQKIVHPAPGSSTHLTTNKTGTSYQTSNGYIPSNTHSAGVTQHTSQQVLTKANQSRLTSQAYANIAQNPAQYKQPAPPVGTITHSLPPSILIQQQKHPAPLPSSTTNMQINPTARMQKLPPQPALQISRVPEGIVLSWNIHTNATLDNISSYQLFAYQETDSPPKTSLWKKVGDVRALPLPMACTLTQFHEGNRYHFAVRAVNQQNAIGSFSEPRTIYLGHSKK